MIELNINEAELDKNFTEGISGNNFCINRLMWITSLYKEGLNGVVAFTVIG